MNSIMWKECKVVMLPTEEATQIIKLNTGSFLQSYKESTKANKENYTNQHLYILSDDKIKEGDWYIDSLVHPSLTNEVLQMVGWCNKKDGVIQSKQGTTSPLSTSKKIIATTDKSLGLSQIPESFIKEYCVKGGIDKVMVEYTNPSIRSYKGQNGFDRISSKPKLSEDNTIIIQLIKENYSREEVITLLNKFNETLNIGSELTLEQWIKKNL